MILRLPSYENISASGDFYLTAKTDTSSSIKFATSGNTLPDITLTASGGTSLQIRGY